MRRRTRRKGERNSLPPLHDKEVELLRIDVHPRLFYDDGRMVHAVSLRVNGLSYLIRRAAKDEMDVMQWLFRLQNKKPKEQTNGIGTREED